MDRCKRTSTAVELPFLVEMETTVLFSYGKRCFGDAFLREGFQKGARCGVCARKLYVEPSARPRENLPFKGAKAMWLQLHNRRGLQTRCLK